MSLKTKLSADVPLFSGMYKGILSIILGLVLIFDPDKSEPKLTYIMGMFWLASGIGLLRQDPGSKMNKRLSQLISVVGIVTGLLVIMRYFSNSVFGLHIVSDPVVNIVLGSVILLTGISHFYAKLELGGRGKQRFLHYVLAVFEIVLGLQLMVLPMVDHLYVRQTVTVWALLGGVLFISTAIHDFRQSRKSEKDVLAGSTADDQLTAAEQEAGPKTSTGEQV
jgi:uncharacterized membrane protein HdeD (DUF308 family)